MPWIWLLLAMFDPDSTMQCISPQYITIFRGIFFPSSKLRKCKMGMWGNFLGIRKGIFILEINHFFGWEINGSHECLYKEICECWYKILPFFLWNQCIQKRAQQGICDFVQCGTQLSSHIPPHLETPSGTVPGVLRCLLSATLPWWLWNPWIGPCTARCRHPVHTPRKLTSWTQKMEVWSGWD